MRKDRVWFLTAELTNRTPVLLKDLTVLDALEDGFPTWTDCIWGLMEINNLIRKKVEDFQKYLDWVLELHCVIYEWRPLFNEVQNPKENLKTFLFTKFIDKIKRGEKRRTIRFNLKKINPGDRFWLVRKIEPNEIFDKTQTNLGMFAKK